jgi:hypothetical protein
MGDATDFSGNYRIEVSGWGLGHVFFVEKTDLLSAESGEKKLLLHRALPDGAVIFIRLIAPGSPYGSVPAAYQVENVQPMNSTGLCEMRILLLHPRSKRQTTNRVASQSPQDSSKLDEPKENLNQPEAEEVLHEA